MPRVIVSNVDPVGQTFIKLNPNIKYEVFEEDTIDLWDLDKRFPNENLFVIVSRHKSKSKIPVFSSHFTGIIDKGMIGYTYPSYHKEYLKIVNELHPKHQVITEPMHHGPVLSKPVMFVEVGSSEKEWKDEENVKIIIDALKILLKRKPKYKEVGIGIGGTHYPKSFTRLILDEEFALGPIVSKYYTDYITESSFKDMIEKCVEKIKYVFMDKGCKKKKYIKELAELFGLEAIEV